MRLREIRFYPVCCISYNCGRTECDGCDSKPILDAFNDWKKQTAAVRPDPIWSPNAWKSTR